MPDLGKLETVTQGNINIVSVSAGTVRPAVIQVAHVDLPLGEYEGATTFTPADEVQTIHIAGLKAVSDITINPIPNNYGRVAYNGAVLTIT